MWINRCAWTQGRLPLMAGGELAGLDRRRVERHLILCASCRRRLGSLKAALEALQVAAAESPVATDAGSRPSSSLWPALARQIQESRRPVVAETWPAWARLANLGQGLSLSLSFGGGWVRPASALAACLVAVAGLGLLGKAWTTPTGAPKPALNHVADAGAPVAPQAAPTITSPAPASPTPPPPSETVASNNGVTAPSRPKKVRMKDALAAEGSKSSRPGDDSERLPQPTDTRDTQ